MQDREEIERILKDLDENQIAALELLPDWVYDVRPRGGVASYRLRAKDQLPLSDEEGLEGFLLSMVELGVFRSVGQSEFGIFGKVWQFDWGRYNQVLSIYHECIPRLRIGRQYRLPNYSDEMSPLDRLSELYRESGGREMQEVKDGWGGSELILFDGVRTTAGLSGKRFWYVIGFEGIGKGWAEYLGWTVGGGVTRFHWKPSAHQKFGHLLKLSPSGDNVIPFPAVNGQR